MKRGDKVRILINAGTMASLNASRFTDYIAPPGTMGVYEGRHSALGDWHIVTVLHEGRLYYAPLHESQMEAVE